MPVYAIIFTHRHQIVMRQTVLTYSRTAKI